MQRSADSLLEQISGTRVARWLPVELPQVSNLRMDLLGETAEEELLHIELQSTNEAQMALRMVEYQVRVIRLYGRFARQIVLYVGQSALHMERELRGPRFSFAYEIFDIREVDAELLLASPSLSDNVISILGRLKDRREAVRRVLRKISQLSGIERADAFQQLSILAGLRKLGAEIKEEVKQMPILDNIMDHDLIGPAIRQGMQQGMQQGFEKGTRDVARHLIEKRFGPIPASFEQRFLAMTAPELDALAVKVIDAKDIAELFG